MDRLHRFVNLLSVATADGSLTEREILFLSQRAREWGLSDHQFAMAVNRSLNHPGEFEIPRSREEREELLRDMLSIMAADGRLQDVEKQLFAIVAAHMEFSAGEIDDIIVDLAAHASPPPSSTEIPVLGPAASGKARKAASSPQAAPQAPVRKPAQPAPRQKRSPKKRPAAKSPAKQPPAKKAAGKNSPDKKVGGKKATSATSTVKKRSEAKAGASKPSERATTASTAAKRKPAKSKTKSSTTKSSTKSSSSQGRSQKKGSRK